MTDLVIIGGGPAGMSAAVAAYDEGVRDILILERDEGLGEYYSNVFIMVLDCIGLGRN